MTKQQQIIILAEDKKEMANRISECDDAIRDFMIHISSDKFRCGNALDGLISTNDVMVRLRTIQIALFGV